MFDKAPALAISQDKLSQRSQHSDKYRMSQPILLLALVIKVQPHHLYSLMNLTVGELSSQPKKDASLSNKRKECVGILKAPHSIKLARKL